MSEHEDRRRKAELQKTLTDIWLRRLGVLLLSVMLLITIIFLPFFLSDARERFQEDTHSLRQRTNLQADALKEQHEAREDALREQHEARIVANRLQAIELISDFPSKASRLVNPLVKLMSLGSKNGLQGMLDVIGSGSDALSKLGNTVANLRTAFGSIGEDVNPAGKSSQPPNIDLAIVNATCRGGGESASKCRRQCSSKRRDDPSPDYWSHSD
jgi:hypothetical protein